MAEDSCTDQGKIKAHLVSVCMPCYNGGKTVEKAISSALAQSVPVEVIVVNDRSTDDTMAVLAQYEKDDRVKVLTNERQLGAAGSRNRAVSCAGGDLVAFLDADDCWREDKLERQIRTLEKTGRILCCSGRELMTPEGRLTGRVIGVRETITYRDELRMNQINCSSVLLRTETAREFPMEHEDSHEDYITWLRILRKYGPAAGIDEPLLRYRLSSTGKSGGKLRSAAMTFRAYRYAGIGPVRSLLCFVTYAIGGVWKYAAAGRRGRRLP